MVDEIREEERRDALRNAQACADLLVASLWALHGRDVADRVDPMIAAARRLHEDIDAITL